MVEPMWAAGRYGEVVGYCYNDVVRLAQLWGKRRVAYPTHDAGGTAEFDLHDAAYVPRAMPRRRGPAAG